MVSIKIYISMKRFYHLFIHLLIVLLLCACSTNDSAIDKNNTNEKATELTIFHINDQHGQIENFSKIKYLVDEEKKQTNVILVCGGDIFSGNPIVDNHPQKGFPMIDLMNAVGFDVSTIGNHEFDYGELILNDRISQSKFSWICANVNTINSSIVQPKAYKSIDINGIKITFLGLVETNGKENDIIPSTHPWRVKNLTFEKYQHHITQYSNLKETEQADLLIALTHLGASADYNIAENFPYFDMIIGGHSHSEINATVNNIPIFQAESNLKKLGKINLVVKNKKIENIHYELIDLQNYPNYNTAIQQKIDYYNANSDVNDIIGYSEAEHTKTNVGSFFTDILRKHMLVDLTIQNTGGIRNTLNKGAITKGEIYSIDPFNNGAVQYTMSIADIKHFLKQSKIAIYYAGLIISQKNETIEIRDYNNQVLTDNTLITIGLNDYIPAVYDTYFTQTAVLKNYTSAEGLIQYLQQNTTPINYSAITNFFQYN